MNNFQQKPIDAKIGVKPVFSALIHSDSQEGPCRTGTPEQLAPNTERERAKESFNRLKGDLKKVLSEDAEILEPTYIEYGEDFAIPDNELKKLETDLENVDLFLLSYRVPGIEEYNKPVAMVGKGVSNVDVAAYLRSRGFEGYAPLDFEELNSLISLLRVRKAIKQTKLLAISNEELITWGVVSSVWNLEDLKKRYGMKSKRVPFKTFYDAMDIVNKKAAESLADKLIKNADEVHMTSDNIVNSVIPYMAAKALMEKHDCNIFTIPCFELCVTKIPAKRKFTPCLTHALLKSEGYPSACEGDLSVLLGMVFLMYLSKKAAYMGNPSVEDKDENILHIQHDMPSLKLEGLNEPDVPYQIWPFTQGGWGAAIRYDFSRDKGREVTLARSDPSATKLLAAKGEIVKGGRLDGGGCSLSVSIKVHDVVDLVHKQADFGHHLAMVYGDYIQQLEELSKIMGFEVVLA